MRPILLLHVFSEIPKTDSPFYLSLSLSLSLASFALKPRCYTFWSIWCCVFWPANGCFAGGLLAKIFIRILTSINITNKKRRKSARKRWKKWWKRGFTSYWVLILTGKHPKAGRLLHNIRSSIRSIRLTLRLIWWLSTATLFYVLLDLQLTINVNDSSIYR